MEAKKLLPPKHLLCETTNISIDGLKVYAKNLESGYGYELAKGSDGKLMTKRVDLNKASKDLLPNVSRDKKQDLYNRMENITREQFETYKKEIESIMPSAKCIYNERNGSIQIDLPVLKSIK